MSMNGEVDDSTSTRFAGLAPSVTVPETKARGSDDCKHTGAPRVRALNHRDRNAVEVFLGSQQITWGIILCRRLNRARRS